MARDIESLVVQLSADFKKYENAMNKAIGVTNRRARAIENRFKAMNANIASGFGGLATMAGRAFALIGGAQGFRMLSDSATRIDNALKVAGLSGEQLEGVYQKLLASAQKNAAPLETLIELYGRVSLVQGELGISSEQLVGFANNIAVAVRASGKSSQEASGALLQLSQALGAGVVRAEEFNSIQEGAPTILQAAAAGIKEAGGSVATLRKLMLDGQLSSKAFFDGINAGAPVLEEKLAGAVLTIDQRFENLKTSLTDSARRFNESSAAASTFGEQVDNLSTFISQIDWDAFIAGIRAAAAEMDSAAAAANAWAVKMGQISGFEGIGRDIVNMLPGEGAIKGFDIPGLPGVGFRITSTAAVTDRINQAFEAEIQKAGDLTAEAIQKSVLGQGKTGRLSESTPLVGPVPSSRPAEVKPVSLADYKIPDSGSDGNGRKSGRNRVNEYEREIQSIRERTAALQAETAAQAAINPLVDDYGYSMSRTQAAQDLLTSAQKAGLAAGKELSSVQQLLAGDFSNLTPAARKQAQAILDMAGQYAGAVEASNKLAEKQDEIRQRAEEALGQARDAVSSVVDGFLEGEKAADMLVSSLKRVGKSLIDDVLNNIFSVKSAFGSGTSGGWLSGLFGLFGGSSQLSIARSGGVGLYRDGGLPGFANGTPSRPGPGLVRGAGTGTSDSILARISNKEFITNARSTAKYRSLLEAINEDRLSAIPAFSSGTPSISAPRLPAIPAQAKSGDISIDARTTVTPSGNAAADAEMRAWAAKRDAELPGKIIRVVKDAQKRRVI